MFKLPLSLLLSAVCALFLLGALLDILANDDNHPLPSQLQLYSTLLDTISQAADQQSSTALPSFIDKQQQHWQLPLQLVARASVALPVELENQLSAAGGLPLAGTHGTSYLKALPQHPNWLLQLTVPTDPGHKPEDLWLTLALYGGLCVIMLLWLAPLTRRLWLLSKTADQFGAGDLRARLPASRWSYISALEQSFNQMAQQIEQLMADNQLLASSLSHDLRTPIACFRFGLDAALDATTPAQKDHYLSRLEQDLDRMEAMVNAFLEYASIDRQHQHGVQQPVDVQQLVEQAIQSCEPLTRTRHLTTQLLPTAQPLPLIDGHPHWLYRVLLNLLQNAQRYARQTIKVQLWSDDKHCFIRIQDDGPGIASADAARIFLPFVRLETQSSTAPQFGLGLAIVVKVLDWHHARILLESHAPNGASFVIALPLQSKKPA